LKDVDESVYVSGTYKGTVSKFKTKNLVLKFTDDLYFRGNVAMTGLPDMESTSNVY